MLTVLDAPSITTSMVSAQEGFILLFLSNVSVRSRQSSYSQTGSLRIECISVPPNVQAVLDRDIFLILRINSEEIPLDPRRVITLSPENVQNGGRTYILHGTDFDPEELELYIPGAASDDQRREDVDILEGIWAEYADFRDLSSSIPSQNVPLTDAPQDLRGQLVLVNEDSGEIIGEVEKKVSIQEDPALSHPEKGHEHDPVIIEINPDEEGSAIQVFARTIPADQQDWMTKSAKLVRWVSASPLNKRPPTRVFSQGISQTTNLLVNVISSASSQYIARSSTASSSSSSINNPATIQSKAVAFISSPRTQSGLTHAHALSAQAVKISGKTLAVIDGMITKMIGAKNTTTEGAPRVSTSTSTLSLPPYSLSPNPSINAKPPLPPRTGDKSLLPLRSEEALVPALPPRTLTKKAKLILSADLILSTLDKSAKQLLDVGSRNATRVVEHQYVIYLHRYVRTVANAGKIIRYGAEAAQSASLMAGTARNIALVYIDMEGVGRKALVQRVGKQYVKSKISK
ncbi:hypothetical protein D9757_001435 [Collybiopsis confluens]|uniref:Senescence domain-containing protein n=1 Tax=Collybiopsis confluens TaxID=2823264 RepID=A0A8H5HZC2_9AGAR|nr:hypothetical protein D9757_001435 [Collybiopsis confluens]